MCLLVLLHKSIPEYPLIIAANRDEDPERGGEAPGRWPDGIAAPRDPKSGGTWIGANSHGVVSAITNRAGPPASGPQVKSRGTLPLEALKEKSAFLVHRRAERIPGFIFSPFNWIYADTEQAFAMEHGGPSDLTVRLRPGIHILSNVHDLNTANHDAVAQFLGIDPERDDINAIVSRLKDILGHHAPLLSEDHRICKHEGLPKTVSASIIAIHKTDRKRSRWLYHEGPPCKNRWKDYSDLLI